MMSMLIEFIHHIQALNVINVVTYVKHLLLLIIACSLLVLSLKLDDVDSSTLKPNEL